MAASRASPFAGLDKALLRPTRATPSGTQPVSYGPGGASSLPIPDRSASRVAPAGGAGPGRASARPPVRSSVSPSVSRRRLVRHPFEFYEDQVERLRRLSLQAQLRGEKTSMSAIVRQALDRYLQQLSPGEA